MNRERAKELLPIIEAFANGKDIQYLSTGATWRKSDGIFADSTKYRIKPTARVFWVFPEINDHESAEHEYCCMGSKPDNPNYIKVREVLE